MGVQPRDPLGVRDGLQREQQATANAAALKLRCYEKRANLADPALEHLQRDTADDCATLFGDPEGTALQTLGRDAQATGKISHGRGVVAVCLFRAESKCGHGFGICRHSSADGYVRGSQRFP
jgi:hypothetical protein